MKQGVVFSIATGTLTASDILTNQVTVNSDPAFSPDMKHLIDMTGVTDVQCSSLELRVLASQGPFGPDSKRALVGPDQLTFELASRYERLREHQNKNMRVFRKLGEALAWLGVDAPEE